MLRKLGFDLVNEVAFGADLVARAYRKLVSDSSQAPYIATSCPAIVAFVERYYPSLVPHLAPVVSPMVAAARALRQQHGDDLQVVFIGPCIAKKGEALSSPVEGDIQDVLTFAELRSLIETGQITPQNSEPADFDPPHAGLGALFPINRGLLQAADIDEDLLSNQVIATDGRSNFVQAIREFANGDMEVQLLEILCCSGCIMGPGITSDTAMFSRRERVSQYVRRRWSETETMRWKQQVAKFSNLNLTRTYLQHDQRIPQPSPEELREIMKTLGKQLPEDELNCGACGYDTCYEHAVAIYKGLAENEMCLPYTIEQLKTTVGQLEHSNEQLANTQEALMHSERLASMGQLAAGVAHEVNNPLGVVLMYAHMLLEETPEVNEEWHEDLQTIVEQADRCKKIVSRLLHFARQNKGVMQSVNVYDLVRKTLKSFQVPENITVAVDQKTNNPVAELDPDQITQVLTNLMTNAFDAMAEGGQLTITVGEADGHLNLEITDTGCGVPEESRSKMFEPFYTTKQMGKGTGLGLSVTHGIIKMHRGKIDLDSNDDPQNGPTGTTFHINLPRQQQES